MNRVICRGVVKSDAKAFNPCFTERRPYTGKESKILTALKTYFQKRKQKLITGIIETSQTRNAENKL